MRVDIIRYFVYSKLAIHYSKVARRGLRYSNYWIAKMEKMNAKMKGEIYE